MLDNESDDSFFLCFRRFFFLSLLNFDLQKLLSFDGLYFFHDESYDNGSESRSPVTCAFPFFSGKSVGSVDKSFGGVSGVGSGVLVLTGIESIDDVVPLFVFVPKGFESKGSRLI